MYLMFVLIRKAPARCIPPYLRAEPGSASFISGLIFSRRLVTAVNEASFLRMSENARQVRSDPSIENPRGENRYKRVQEVEMISSDYPTARAGVRVQDRLTIGARP